MAAPTAPADQYAGAISAANPGAALQETASGGVNIGGQQGTQQVNYTPAETTLLGQNEATINTGNAQLAATNEQIALDKQNIALEQADLPGTAVSLNLNQLNSQAQQSAQNTVNPLYTQYLNQYLQEMGANQQAAQAQNTLNIQGEQTSLGNTLQQNVLGENAAASTNALTQGNINAQQQNYQLSTGNAQAQKLQALGQGTGQSGIGASGLGQQQIYEAENARNTADAAQSGQFQYQRNTSNLSTQDTFAQLAQSSAYATTAEGQEEAQTNFNLNDYLRQAAYNDSQYTQALQASQQQAITAATAQDEATAIQQQIAASAPTGSKNYAASETAYSNLLNPSTSLPSAPSQNDYLNAYGTSV